MPRDVRNLKDRKEVPARSLAPVEAPQAEPQEPQGPQVSVILMTFNQAPALRRAVEALERSQARERLEIVVVDCASTDGSAEIDTDFPAVNVLRLPHHIGAARALNIASRTAKAELFFYLSPDVAVEPGTIPALMARLENEPDAAAACPLLVDPEGNPVSRLAKLPTAEVLAAVCRGEPLPTAALDPTQESIAIDYPGMDAILVRKLLVRSMNYFDQRFGHYWADADLAMQIRRAGKKIRLYPAIRATHYPAPDPLAGDSLAAADLVAGAAAFVGKYSGFGAGLVFRLKAALGALARFDFGRLTGLLSGRKLDGSQAG